MTMINTIWNTGQWTKCHTVSVFGDTLWQRGAAIHCGEHARPTFSVAPRMLY
eukprot:m.16586 g.16586  ORF g.16586 m.16586 type:complete len:52 (+) comp9047_c0_seq2:1574-1729(+)